ncbi:MAG: TonB-dependent receptor [Phenylobacterium sp.]|uniref:TonB-dependent receptor n=1 Tax=Phenylobacterium sp. TaxID=1871053 RepID=UPI00391DAE81
MKFRRKLAAGAALIALCAASGGAAAQEAPADLSEVVITATRSEVPRSAVPASVEVIGPQDLQVQSALGFSAIETVSALAPSFSPTRQKLSGFGETLRGRSALFLVDGVPQSTPLRDDSRDGFTIDPFFIDRVEIVFGSSAIQGLGATGGVVNYVTAPTPKTEEGWAGRVLGQYSFDEGVTGDSVGWKTAAMAGRDFGQIDLLVGAAYEARGAYYDAEGRRIGFDGAQGELQDSRSWSLFAKAGVDLTDERRIEVMANHFELDGDNDYVTVNGSRALGLPTTAVRGRAPGEATSNEITSAAVTYRDGAFLGGVLTAQAFAHDYAGVFGGGSFATFQDPAIAPIGTLFDQSANNSEKLGFKVDYQRGFAALPGFRAQVGLDGLRDKTYQELILTGRNWVPETRYESLSPFLQLRQSMAEGRVHLSAGVRQENAKLKVDDFTTLWFYGPQTVAGGAPDFSETLTNVGATFEVVDGVTAYASYAQGFTMADVGRVLRAVSTAGADVDSYLDISPVVSDNVEVGVELSRGPVQASAAWYRSTSDQGSLLTLVGGVFEVQRQRTEIEGVELTARWDVNEAVAVGGAYAHLDGRADSDGDGSVDVDLDGANIGPDRLMLYLEARRGPVSGRLQTQTYFDRSFDGQPAANSFEGYSVADLVVNWNAPMAVFSLGVQNLTDEQYITYFSDTQAPTDNARFFAGRGRTLTFSVSKTF